MNSEAAGGRMVISRRVAPKQAWQATSSAWGSHCLRCTPTGIVAGAGAVERGGHISRGEFCGGFALDNAFHKFVAIALGTRAARIKKQSPPDIGTVMNRPAAERRGIL